MSREQDLEVISDFSFGSCVILDWLLNFSEPPYLPMP